MYKLVQSLEWAGEPYFAAFGSVPITLIDTSYHQNACALLKAHDNGCTFARWQSATLSQEQEHRSFKREPHNLYLFIEDTFFLAL